MRVRRLGRRGRPAHSPRGASPRGKAERGRALQGGTAGYGQAPRGQRPAGLGRATWKEFFSSTQIPLWEEDFSVLALQLERLRKQGVVDLEGYLRSRPGELRELADSVRVLSVNDAVVALLEAPDRSSLLGGLSVGFDEESYMTFIEELVRIYRGERRFTIDFHSRSFSGKELYLQLQWTAAPGSERKLDRVYVSALDLSARVATEIELRRSLSEKEALVREMHHRVSNNLAIVSSLLDIEARRSDAAESRILATALERIDAMAIVHDSLYLSEDLARVGLEDCVAQVARGAFLRQAASSCLELEIKTDGTELPIDRAVPCGLLVNELVMLCVRRASEEGRRVQLRLKAGRLAGGGVELELEASGGILSLSLEGDSEESISTTLIRLLAHQLEGELRQGRAGDSSLRLLFPS